MKRSAFFYQQSSSAVKLSLSLCLMSAEQAHSHPNQPTDEQLIYAFLKGNLLAFAILFRQHKTLREFYLKHPDSEGSLKAWYKEAIHAQWNSPPDIKRKFANASIIADNRIVFNIKGNKYRLIVKFNYKYGWAWIRFIGTHAQYDKTDAAKI
jgi:mRNA interferase HigB